MIVEPMGRTMIPCSRHRSRNISVNRSMSSIVSAIGSIVLLSLTSSTAAIIPQLRTSPTIGESDNAVKR